MPTIVITGASSGIGAEAARALASQGWHVAVVGRNPERTASVAAEVGGRAFLADFDRLDDVRALAAQLRDAYERIDVLANNAGGLISERAVTVDGHERTFQLNHLAPFLLTDLLKDRVGRVVATASVAHRFGAVHLDDLERERHRWAGGWPQYGAVKRETMLFVRELARRGMEAYSFHPGYVSTGFGADNAFIKFSLRVRPGGFGIPAREGAMPLVMLATAERPAASGTYFNRMKPGSSNAQTKDMDLAAALWERSAELVSSR